MLLLYIFCHFYCKINLPNGLQTEIIPRTVALLRVMLYMFINVHYPDVFSVSESDLY